VIFSASARLVVANVTFRALRGIACGALTLAVATLDAGAQQAMDDGRSLQPFGGEWSIGYTDRVLGPIIGTARYIGSRIEVDLLHPKTGGTYRLQSFSIVRDDTHLTIEFEGKSPPSGFDGASTPPEPIAGATPLAIPIGSTVVATVAEGRNSAPARADEVPPRLERLKLVLDVPTDGPIEQLDGKWSYQVRDERDIRYSRAGVYDSDVRVVSGPETWKRVVPPVLFSVQSGDILISPVKLREALDEPKHYLHQNATSARADYPPDGIGRMWLTIEGENLPYQARRRVSFTVDDPNAAFTGKYRSWGESSMQVEVVVRESFDDKPKPVSLNDAPGMWYPDLANSEPASIQYVRRSSESEFEAVDTLYLGDVFFLEATYPGAPYTNRKSLATIGFGGERVEYPVDRLTSGRKSQPELYRSGPLLVIEPFNSSPVPGSISPNATGASAAAPVVMRSQEGDHLATYEVDLAATQPAGPGSPPKTTAVIKVTDHPPTLWEKALARARACREKGSATAATDYIVTDALAKASPAELAALGILGYVAKEAATELLSDEGSSLRRRIDISLEDHAAAILVRDELGAALDVHIAKLNKSPVDHSAAPDDIKRQEALWRAAQLAEVLGLIGSAQGKLPPSELLRFPVSRPSGIGKKNAAGEFIGGVGYWADALRPQATYTLGDALHGANLALGFQNDLPAFLEYARKVVDEAKGAQLSHAADALKRTQKADECNTIELLKLVGVGTSQATKRILPKLVRPSRGTEYAYPRYVPDAEARKYVGNIGILAEAIAAQSDYNEIDKDAVIAAVTAPALLATAGIGASYLALEGFGYAATAEALIQSQAVVNMMKAAQTVMTAADIYDLYALTRDSQGLGEALRDVDYARGISGVAGTERLDIAKAQAEGKLISVAMGGSLGAVPNIVQGIAAGKVEIPAWLHRKVQADAMKVGLDGLPADERPVFDRMAANAQSKNAANGPASLTPDEAAVLAIADADAAGRRTGPVGNVNQPSIVEPPSQSVGATPDSAVAPRVDDAPPGGTPRSEPTDSRISDDTVTQPPPSEGPVSGEPGSDTVDLAPSARSGKSSIDAPTQPPGPSSASGSSQTGMLSPSDTAAGNLRRPTADYEPGSSTGSSRPDNANASSTGADEPIRLDADDDLADTEDAAYWRQVYQGFRNSDLARSFLNDTLAIGPYPGEPSLPGVGGSGHVYEPGEFARLATFFRQNGLVPDESLGQVAGFWRSAGIAPDDVMAGHVYWGKIPPAATGLSPDQFRSSLDRFLRDHVRVSDPIERQRVIDQTLARFADEPATSALVNPSDGSGPRPPPGGGSGAGSTLPAEQPGSFTTAILPPRDLPSLEPGPRTPTRVLPGGPEPSSDGAPGTRSSSPGEQPGGSTTAVLQPRDLPSLEPEPRTPTRVLPTEPELLDDFDFAPVKNDGPEILYPPRRPPSSAAGQSTLSDGPAPDLPSTRTRRSSPDSGQPSTFTDGPPPDLPSTRTRRSSPDSGQPSTFTDGPPPDRPSTSGRMADASGGGEGLPPRRGNDSGAPDGGGGPTTARDIEIPPTNPPPTPSTPGQTAADASGAAAGVADNAIPGGASNRIAAIDEPGAAAPDRPQAVADPYDDIEIDLNPPWQAVDRPIEAPPTVTGDWKRNADGSWVVNGMRTSVGKFLNQVFDDIFQHVDKVLNKLKFPGGRFADVHALVGADGTELGYVRKLFGQRRNWTKNDSGKYVRDDAIGRDRAVNMVERTVDGAAVAVKADVAVLDIVAFDTTGANPSIVQRQANRNLDTLPPTRDGGKVVKEVFADEIELDQGYLPKEHAEALATMLEKLWRAGAVMEDIQLPNFFFRTIEFPDGRPPRIEAGISDPDRIDWFKTPRNNSGSDSVASFMGWIENAPHETKVFSRNQFGTELNSPEEAMLAFLEHRTFLQYDHDKNVFTSRWIPLDILKNHFDRLKQHPGQSSDLSPSIRNVASFRCRVKRLQGRPAEGLAQKACISWRLAA
jgi:hypothetical protein